MTHMTDTQRSSWLFSPQDCPYAPSKVGMSMSQRTSSHGLESETALATEGKDSQPVSVVVDEEV